MMDNQAIGASLAHMRRYYRITQDELAARLGVSRQAVSRWETGAGLPDVAQLMRLSKIYGVTVDDILRGNGAAVARHGTILADDAREPRRVVVIGAGRWGCFLAWYAARIGHQVTLVGRRESENFRALRISRTSGCLTLPESITLSDDMTCASEADFLLISVPAQQLAALAGQLAEMELRGRTIVLCMKGVEASTGRRLTQVITDALDHSNEAVVWVGPGHAEEFLRGVPNCMVIDSAGEMAKQAVIRAFSSDLIRFYYGRDLVGSEIGAAAKNVIGIAAGMLDGLGLTSLKGALMSRGTREVARLIVAMGGDAASASGLCHLGDYEATLFSPHSRNRAFGECWVRGERFGSLAEGYATVRALRSLGKSHGVELPICETVYRILYEGTDARRSLDRLFARSLKDEF
ncbi:MAG: NAD(P)H-dependent glycerol-3-phosphate dehydrogenase [Clostridia bacterium]|nr:NAD(P)H-dependent glycerol-3-phosphate dehydrogenase [Clostridia bacterium]